MGAVEVRADWRSWAGWSGLRPGCRACDYGADYGAFCCGVAGCHARGVNGDREPDLSLGCHCEACVKLVLWCQEQVAKWLGY